MRKDEMPKDKDLNIHLKSAKEQQIKLRVKEDNKEQKLIKEKTNVLSIRIILKKYKKTIKDMQQF